MYYNLNVTADLAITHTVSDMQWSKKTMEDLWHKIYSSIVGLREGSSVSYQISVTLVPTGLSKASVSFVKEQAWKVISLKVIT